MHPAFYIAFAICSSLIAHAFYRLGRRTGRTSGTTLQFKVDILMGANEALSKCIAELEEMLNAAMDPNTEGGYAAEARVYDVFQRQQSGARAAELASAREKFKAQLGPSPVPGIQAAACGAVSADAHPGILAAFACRDGNVINLSAETPEARLVQCYKELLDIALTAPIDGESGLEQPSYVAAEAEQLIAPHVARLIARKAAA